MLWKNRPPLSVQVRVLGFGFEYSTNGRLSSVKEVCSAPTTPNRGRRVGYMNFRARKNSDCSGREKRATHEKRK